MKFVVFEVWTAWRVIDAKDHREAYQVGDPRPRPDSGLNLSNWHVVAADGSPEPDADTAPIENAAGPEAAPAIRNDDN